MEITNEERREVAERLRRQARWMNKNKDWYDKDDVDQGNRAYRNIADSVEEGSNFSNHYEETVRKLADLIDRPTCKNAKLYKDVFECSECHCSLELITGVCNEYGEPFSVPFMPRYCPACGAEVQE